MKELILVRHAKSCWKDTSLKDFDRPLNERGIADAPKIAIKISERNDFQPDVFITSAARRTKDTCSIFASVMTFPHTRIIVEENLYEISKKNFYQFIKKLDNNYNSVVIFGHNSVLTEFINEQTNVRIDNLPTSGVYAFKIEMNNWSDFEKANKKFWFFEYPKLY